MSEMLYIDQPAALAELCRSLQSTPWLALDTEFVREKTFRPCLCLIQVATPDLVACIDPLALPALDPLLDLFYEPQRLKILHAAFQDLEILYWLRGAPPAPVFDTQIAAAALGYGEQISYGALVERLLGIRLDKAHTRTDWSRRPLHPEQIRYAAEDVIYLAQIYPRLLAELSARGRLGWVEEECLYFSEADTYSPEARLQWRRLPGAGELPAQKLNVLRALALWRERQAMTADRPRQWLLSDLALTELAERLPRTWGELAACPIMGDAAAQRYGKAVLEVIATALAEPAAQWPHQRLKLSVEQAAQVQALMRRLRALAEQHQLAPSLIATRADLEALVRGEDVAQLAQGWRAELLAGEWQEILARTSA